MPPKTLPQGRKGAKRPLTEKERNEHCRAALQDAIRSIQQADSYWNIVTPGFVLIVQLTELKARVRAELSRRAA